MINQDELDRQISELERRVDEAEKNLEEINVLLLNRIDNEQKRNEDYLTQN